MSDLFPQEPTSTAYSTAFEACWKVHNVGNKKAAWKAGEKAGWSDGNWVWLEQYLSRRWREDAKWIEGKYIPHLSTIINGERWDDNYRKIRRHVGAQTSVETHEEAMAKLDPRVRADAEKAARERLH